MIDEVIARLAKQHLIIVHGASGCGKSSLVRAACSLGSASITPAATRPGRRPLRARAAAPCATSPALSPRNYVFRRALAVSHLLGSPAEGRTVLILWSPPPARGPNHPLGSPKRASHLQRPNHTPLDAAMVFQVKRGSHCLSVTTLQGQFCPKPAVVRGVRVSDPPPRWTGATVRASKDPQPGQLS